MAAGEKTEAPTGKRRQEVREQGQVARSVELGTATSFLATWLVLRSFGQGTMTTLADMFSLSLRTVKQPDMSDTALAALGMQHMLFFVKVLAPFAGLLLITGVVTSVAQVGLHLTPKAMRPQFGRLNPLQGAKRLVSVQALENLAKSVLKIAIVGFVAYKVLNDHMIELSQLTGSDLRGGLALGGGIGMELLLKVGLAFLVIALADYIFQRWQFEKNLKMTKQEVKEEGRSQEMANEVKSRIKSLQRAMSRKRMMQRVPQADVVITNPTHYAVALKYNADKMTAPMVVAKGQRLVAQQIKEIARQHGVPMVENRPLAQALFRAVEVDQEVPRELYKAVAEVLAFIYRIKQQRMAS
jgi:flagellar biosynthetic protein FlhB